LKTSVLFVTEIRSHGVGFYKFDRDEQTRQAQLEQLNQIRQQVLYKA